MINEKKIFLTVNWLSGLLSAEIFTITGEWGIQMPPLTAENSHFLRSGTQEAALVMVRRHLDNNKILRENNYGFGAKHSTETQLLLTTHEMLMLRDNGKQLDVVMLDFSKAFDKVPHGRQLGKLDFYWMRGNLLTWAEAFLIGRTQSVPVDGIRSKKEDVHSGVLQGTVLGLLTFLLYINDLRAHLDQRSSCHLFLSGALSSFPRNATSWL